MGFDCLAIMLKPDCGIFVKNLATRRLSLRADFVPFNLKSIKQDQQIHKLCYTNLAKKKTNTKITHLLII